MRKPILFALLAAAVFCLSGLPVRAQEPQDGVSAIPDEYKEFFVKDGQLVLPDLPAFLSLALSALKAEVKNSGSDLALFLSSILACSVFSLFAKTVSKNAEGPLRIALLLCGCLCVYGALKGLFDVTSAHLTSLSRTLTSFIPAVTAACAASGGVTSAVLSSTALGMILAFVSQYTLGVLFPMLKTLFALDMASEVASFKPLSSLARGVRSLFLTLLGVVSTLLSGVFALQNVIAAKSDSLSLRAFRFTVGSALPMVGSVFSESSKTLLSSLSLMRSTVGAVGVCLILLLLLPTLLLLLFARITLKISSSFASSLEVSPVDALFSVGASAAGGLCAVVALTDLSAAVALASTMYTAL